MARGGTGRRGLYSRVLLLAISPRQLAAPSAVLVRVRHALPVPNPFSPSYPVRYLKYPRARHMVVSALHRSHHLVDVRRRQPSGV